MNEEINPDPLKNVSDVEDGSKVAAEPEVKAEAAPEAEKTVEPEVKAEAAPEAEKVAEPEVKAEAAPEAEKAAEPEAEEAAKPEVNYAAMTLSELGKAFEDLMADPESMKLNKEAEAIKSAFYKKLSKAKAEAGLEAPLEPTEEEAENAEVETAESEPAEKVNPFEAVENGFKEIYSKYKKARAEYNKKLDEEREENLAKKQQVVEELKTLIDKQDDVSALFPEFRALQARWREIGPVPQQSFRELNETYQFNVERFYDKVQINREMRDLDFKKNLEVKEGLCQEAEKLAENENIVEAFHELQKLHERWKEYGPVDKEHRESIWERFKEATAVINKKYQAYFEDQKDKQVENLAEKTKLCEEVEAIAAKEDIKSSSDWNNLTKQIIDIQASWRKIGFATKKENQKIYDRFRAACDKFFDRKREFYTEFKDSMNSNMDKKLALIEKAEALKTSTDWKAAAEAFKELQKEWKEIGSVPRKKSEQLWKRFRAAADEFFAARDSNAKPGENYHANLEAKKKLIEEIKAFEPSSDAQVMSDALQTYLDKWQTIGFVPFKEKEGVNAAFDEAMKSKFPDYNPHDNFAGRIQRGARRIGERVQRTALSEKDRLIQQYNRLQEEIKTYENNIGFFANSKGAQSFVDQFQKKIDSAKAQLKELEGKIRGLGQSEEAGEEDKKGEE